MLVVIGKTYGNSLEEVPNVHLKIQTLDGNVFVYTIDEIERKTKEVKKARAAVIDASPRAPSDVKLEKWYTYWGLGYANPDYTEELGELIDDCYRCDRFSMGLDLFGFYWPLQDQKTILGFVWNAAMDRYSDEYDNWVQLVSGQWSISGMHFIQSGIGKGPFIRTDLGYGIFTSVDDDGNEGLKDEQESGVSLLVGGGYGLPLGAEGGTRILLNANLAFRPGADDLEFYSSRDDRYYRGGGKVRVFSLTAGFLF